MGEVTLLRIDDLLFFTHVFSCVDGDIHVYLDESIRTYCNYSEIV